MEVESVFGFHLHNELFKQGIINEKDVVIADEHRLTAFKESIKDRQRELQAKQYKDRKKIFDEVQELLLRKVRSTEQNDKLVELLNKLGLELDEHGLVTLDTHSPRKRTEKKYLCVDEPCFSLQERRLIEEEESSRVQRRDLRALKVWLRKIGGAQVQVRKSTLYGPDTNWKDLEKQYRMRTRDRMNQMETGRRQKINSLCADHDKEWKRILYRRKATASPAAETTLKTTPEPSGLKRKSTEQSFLSKEEKSAAVTTTTDDIEKLDKPSSGKLPQSKSLIQQLMAERKSIHEFHLPLSMRLRSSDLENAAVQKRLKVFERWIGERTGDAETRKAGKICSSTSMTRRERKSLSSKDLAFGSKAKSASQLSDVKRKQPTKEEPSVSKDAKTVSTQKAPGVVRSMPLKVLKQANQGIKTLQAGTAKDKAGQDGRIDAKVSSSVDDSKDQGGVIEAQTSKSVKGSLNYDEKSEQRELKSQIANLRSQDISSNTGDILKPEFNEDDEMVAKEVSETALESATSSPEQSEEKLPENVHTDDDRFSSENLSATETSADDIKEESILLGDYESAPRQNASTELPATKHDSDDDDLADTDSDSKRKVAGLDDKSVEDDEKSFSDGEKVISSDDETEKGNELVFSDETHRPTSEAEKSYKNTEEKIPALLKQSEDTTTDETETVQEVSHVPSKDESSFKEKTSLEQLYEEINALAHEFYRQKESSSDNGLKGLESNSGEFPPILSSINDESVTSKIVQDSSECVVNIGDEEESNSNIDSVLASSDAFTDCEKKYSETDKQTNTMLTPIQPDILQDSGSAQSTENAVHSSDYEGSEDVSEELVDTKSQNKLKKSVTEIRLRRKPADFDNNSTFQSRAFQKQCTKKNSKEIHDESNSNLQSFKDTEPLLESKSRRYRRSLPSSNKSKTADFQISRKSKAFSAMSFGKLPKARKTKLQKSKYEKLDDYTDDDDEN